MTRDDDTAFSQMGMVYGSNSFCVSSIFYPPPQQTNIFPEDWWLEDENSFEHGSFSGDIRPSVVTADPTSLAAIYRVTKGQSLYIQKKSGAMKNTPVV